ncbi:hypothetical protein [Alicyclobacillus sp. SO9]|uniref:hypothetical protein n=1 Tax=Alicyclobacillus sp. SO9 TaxID=2665646 RepID=UPI0018E85E51|nr:hypothetical protein [Alicyclobacillus sp. SO9]QQE77266.1 hypothetical protein GI364_15000 [Alicyclobacillus sp. SO9]
MNDERAERRIAGRRWDWFTRNPLYVHRNYDEFLAIAEKMSAELCPLIEALNYNVPLDDAMEGAGLTSKI